VNVHLRLWLTCLLLSASCCWRLYWLQISRVSLTFTYLHRLCLLRILLGVTTTVTNFPLSTHTGGGGTTPAFSGWHVYLQFTWEVSRPPSPVELSSHSHFYKFSHSWLLGRCPHSCLLWLACLPLWCSQHPILFATCLFCCCLLFSLCFSLFSLDGGHSVQGLYWSGPGLFVGVPHAS
jgi:hypothetical protein